MGIFAVTTAKGPNWDHARSIREQEGWQEHGDFADGLVRRGVILVGGPIGGADGEDVALLAVEAADEEEITALFDADPWTQNGVFRLKDIRPWVWWLDGRTGSPAHPEPRRA